MSYLRRHWDLGRRTALRGAGVCLAIGLAVLFLPPVADGQGAGEPPPFSAEQFSHKVHVPAVGGQCVLCHEPRLEGKFYLTSEDVCWRCHDNDVPEAQRDEFKANMRAFARARIVGPFHHERHMKNSKAAGMPAERCADCHQDIEKSDRSTDPNIPAMDYCYTCHTQITSVSENAPADLASKGGTECSLCHVPGDFSDEKWKALAESLAEGKSQEEIDPDLIPESHKPFMEEVLGARTQGYFDQSWIPGDHTEYFRTVSHGRKSRATRAQCKSCHTHETCVSCHEYQTPRSHTPRFIRSYHGRYATIDKHKCKVCHQADFCASCHDVPPRNHSIAFQQGDHSFAARVELRSCFQCHVFDIDCIRCHTRRP